MRNRALLITLAFTLAACGQQATTISESPVVHSQSISATAGLGDQRAFTSDGTRWWAGGTRWWAGGTRWWAGGTRWWAGGTRWWAGGTFEPVPENSAAFNLIGLDRAQDLAPRMGEGVLVAVIDTGVDAAHPMLDGATLPGYDYIDRHEGAHEAGSDQDLAFGHGTAVAGLIRQVAPAATILPLRVISPDGSGVDKHIAEAIRDATAAGARVINLSLSAPAPTGGVRAAIVEATRRGVIVVAASGNNGASRPQAPAWQMSNPDPAGGMSLSVGATEQDGSPVHWSNAGAELVAPGVSLTSAYPGERLVNATGTSFSAPLVSGAVALALAQGAYAGDLTETLKSSSQKGRLDVAALLTRIQ